MKAIKIDAKNKTITEVEILGNTLDAWYKEIGCELIQAVPVTIRIKGSVYDQLIVDEEGKINGKKQHEFLFKDFNDYLSGNALIVGIDDEGNSTDCVSTVSEIKSKVRFPKFSQF